MITYEYICSTCEYVHEIKQSPQNFKKLKKCPNCKKNTLEQQYFSNTHLHIKSSPTTLSQLAETNSKKMGKMGLEDKRREDKRRTMQMKFSKHVEAGKIDADHANHIIEKTLDKPQENALELDRSIKKKISTGTKEEKQKKIDNYIKKGTIE